jgi:hypothetical protein
MSSDVGFQRSVVAVELSLGDTVAVNHHVHFAASEAESNHVVYAAASLPVLHCLAWVASGEAVAYCDEPSAERLDHSANA